MPIKASVKWKQGTLILCQTGLGILQKKSPHATQGFIISIFITDVVLLLQCIILKRGSFLNVNFSWALHTETPINVFLMWFDLQLWRLLPLKVQNRRCEKRLVCKRPDVAECRRAVLTHICFPYTLHTLISTPDLLLIVSDDLTSAWNRLGLAETEHRCSIIETVKYRLHFASQSED